MYTLTAVVGGSMDDYGVTPLCTTHASLLVCHCRERLDII